MAVKRLCTTWHSKGSIPSAHTHTCMHTHSYIYTNLPILLFRSKFKWDQYFILSLHFRFHRESTVLAASFHSVLSSLNMCLCSVLGFCCISLLSMGTPLYILPSLAPQVLSPTSFPPSLLSPLFSLTIIWTRGIVNLFALISVFRKVCIFKWTIRAMPLFKLFN